MLSKIQLETLSSAGLIRRAEKSLNKSHLNWINKGETVWAYNFENNIGSLDLCNLNNSQCDCPAAGLCKHIVAAALSNINQTTVAVFEPPELNLHSLFSEAGKSACRYVFQTWQSQWLPLYDDTKLTKHATIEVTSTYCLLNYDDQKAVIGSNTGLTAITVEAGDTKEKLMAAVLYVAISGGIISWPDWLLAETKLKLSTQQKHTQELKSRLKNQLLALTSRGLTSLAPTNLIELVTQAPIFKAAGEPKLGNGILTLAQWVERRSSNQGLDPSSKILQQIVDLYAQCESSKSEESFETKLFKKLNLYCLGGHQWVNANGALGLSMVFTSDDGKIYAATLMRNQKVSGFSPDQAWKNQNLWLGSPINEQLTGRYFTITNAKLNRWQSLSLSETVDFKTDDETQFQWQATTDWQTLKATTAYGYALLSVKRWLDCDFDETNQELVIQVEDDNNQVLVIRQPYEKNTERRIANILDHWKAQAKYLLVRYVPSDNAHNFEPIAMYHKQWMSFDFMKAKKSSVSLLKRMIDRFNKQELQQQVVDDDLMKLLSALEDELKQYPNCDTPHLERINQQLQALGLTSLTHKLTTMAQDSEQLLQLSYLVGALKRLHSRWPIYNL